MWREAHYLPGERLLAEARAQTIQLVAPDLWLVECANGCWKRVRRGVASAQEARAAFQLITAWSVVLMDTSALQDIILDVALENLTTSYDALYIATAQFANAPLITTDTKLLETLRAAQWPGRAMHLSEY